MFTLERQNQIITILKEKKSASVVELAKMLFIGQATIRRDLDLLQKQNLIKRTYGGAVLLEGLNIEIPLYVRESEQAVEKETIGEKAAELVHDGDTLILDSSSTTYSMIHFLKSKENLTVITNGVKTTIALGEILHAKVYCISGRLRENSLSLVGEQSKKFISNYQVETLFFSCRGIVRDIGAMDSSDDEAELRKEMIKISKRVVLLCDSSKFDKTAFYKVCELDKIDYIITDKQPNEEWMTFFDQHGIKLIV
jgi:DeoR/GlpR family transcriptional regulator of sugar metabolism